MQTKEYRELKAEIQALRNRVGGALTTISGGGSGDVSGPGSSTDKAIARWDGAGGDTLQDSTPIVEDDGRISSLTDPTNAQDAATKAYVDAATGGGGGSAYPDFTAPVDGDFAAR